jgi:hypothetical protein
MTNSKTGVMQTKSGRWYAQAELGGKLYHGRFHENLADAEFEYKLMISVYEYHGILPNIFRERTEQNNI